jgi:hypothetical protein
MQYKFAGVLTDKNKWVCAKKTQLLLHRSLRTSTKTSYMGLKKLDNLKYRQPLAKSESPSSQFLIMLYLNSRILNNNPYIGCTTKKWPTFYTYLPTYFGVYGLNEPFIIWYSFIIWDLINLKWN